MDQHRRSKLRVRVPAVARPQVEPLELRQLLSSALPSVTAAPPPPPPPPPAGAPMYNPADGYSPQQVRHAYGFDQVTFNHGTIPGDGRGQTIALVDAQDNPTMMQDLATFDAQFGLPAPPSFRIVDQRGGNNLPAADPGWAPEIALDVEWSHAIAPMANILLVETDTQDFSNLVAGVDFARHQPGVSAISMSWGGNEFFQWNGGEGEQTQFDPIFNTPAGHQGITFVAAAGDHTAQAGVLFPSAEPNVISVGGTSLNLADASGTYGNETYWSGTNSGYSNLEREPQYQIGVQNTGYRSSPDVTYNADSATGVAVYSQFAFGGWFPVGGTSAGSPQFAALVAIADQGRALNGLGTLDGPTQTLPILYSLYSPPFTPGYSTYTSYFNDVDAAGSPTVTWRFGGSGFNDIIPVKGFDTGTGLGSPRAQNLIPALAMLSAPPLSPIVATVVSPPKATGMGGKLATFKVRVTNTGSTTFDGPVTMNLNAQPSSGAPATMQVDSAPLGMFDLKPGKSKVVTVKYYYPYTLASGSYLLRGALFTPQADTTATPLIVNTAPVIVAQPTIDLSISAGTSTPVLVHAGATSTAELTITNVGNIPADGFANLQFYASKSKTLDTTATLLPAVPGHKIRLRPGESVRFRVPFYAPNNMVGGTYFILAKMIPSTQPADANTANNVTALSTRAS